MKKFENVVLDIEANNLIEPLLDFTVKPYVLKPEARLWCIALRDLDDKSITATLSLDQCTRDNLRELLKDTKRLVMHNGVGYDLIMLQLFGVMEYTIGYEGQSDTIFGDQEVEIIDTLLLSKLLKQDRFGGHSVEAWGNRLGVPKIDFNDFSQYTEEMLEYCLGDVLTQSTIYDYLIEEMEGEAGWNKYWKKAYRMEVKLMDLVAHSALRGFWFDTDLAKQAVEVFQEQIDTIKAVVDPRLPPRPMTKGEQSNFVPPKIQFKKNGDVSSNMEKFVEKVGAQLIEDNSKLLFEGKVFDLPYNECIKDSLPGSIDSLDNLKAFLLELGWLYTEIKERDLTKDSKKVKLSDEKLDATIIRYVENTLNGPFKEFRLKELDITEDKLLAYLMSKRGERSIVVPVSPSIKVGATKELCPNLELLGESADFVGDVVKYLTYKHRRNSISGSKEDDDGEPLTGFLSMVRDDHRISTNADTLGAVGGRFKHRGVCNIPRVSSLGGEYMRGIFGVDIQNNRFQLGFDYSALEACISGHYVYNYTDGIALAASYTAEKPNDCFDLDTQVLTSDGWKFYEELSNTSLIAQWDHRLKTVSYANPSQIIYRNNSDGEMIHFLTDRIDLKVTPNHIVVIYNKSTNSYIELAAKDVEEYLKLNSECYIPNSGYSTKDFLDNLKTDLTGLQIIPKDSGFVVRSEQYSIIEKVVTEQRLSGSGSLIIEKTIDGKQVYQTLISKAPLNVNGFKITQQDISYIKDDFRDVWCLTVPSNKVFIKRNDKIVITGQCHTILQKKMGLPSRDIAKILGYSILYGAAAPKIAKTLGIPLKEAEEIYAGYWESVPALKELKQKVEAFWKKTGKQYILGIDGRKLYVRSQHSLLNLLFQGAGATAVKYSAVGISRRLEELGLLGNVLKDTEEDEKNKIYTMIIYHDELQFDLGKDLLKLYEFDSEEEAKEAKKLYKDSSAIGHTKEGKYYFCESNILSTIINEEIYKVCIDLELRVPLGMEYNVGANWKDCH